MSNIRKTLGELKEMVAAPIYGNIHVDEKLSPEAQDFISKKIGILSKEGKKGKQAVAIAYAMARKAGFKVPEKKEDLGPEAGAKDIRDEAVKALVRLGELVSLASNNGHDVDGGIEDRKSVV